MTAGRFIASVALAACLGVLVGGAFMYWRFVRASEQGRRDAEARYASLKTEMRELTRTATQAQAQADEQKHLTDVALRDAAQIRADRDRARVEHERPVTPAVRAARTVRALVAEHPEISSTASVGYERRGSRGVYWMTEEVYLALDGARLEAPSLRAELAASGRAIVALQGQVRALETKAEALMTINLKLEEHYRLERLARADAEARVDALKYGPSWVWWVAGGIAVATAVGGYGFAKATSPSVTVVK